MSAEDCKHIWALAFYEKSTAQIIKATWLCPLCAGFMVLDHTYDVNQMNLPLSVQLARGIGKKQREPQGALEEAEAN